MKPSSTAKMMRQNFAPRLNGFLCDAVHSSWPHRPPNREFRTTWFWSNLGFRWKATSDNGV